MVSRNNSPRSKKSVSLSVIVGTLLVPLSAYAASSLVETSGAAESVTAPETSPVVESAANAAPSIAADLETACGPAGLAMVDAEKAGTISQLQQSALDALRGICTEQGMPLPTPPMPQPVAQPAAPPTAPASGQALVASEDDDHHGRHGGDDDDHGRHGGDDDDEDDHGRHGEDHD